jgi:hypothetical protein
MGDYAKRQALKGSDVAIRLYRNGQPLDIIEAETIGGGPNLQVVESAPLSLGYTTRDTHVDGYRVVVQGVRKGNAFLQEILAQVRRNQASGKAFEKYTALIQYRDPNTNTIQPLKIVDATLTELDDFASGGIFEKQSEGFQLVGQLK